MAYDVLSCKTYFSNPAVLVYLKSLTASQVKEMKRRDMYERHMLLQKIQQETIKAHGLLEQRTALQEARKMANMDASFQRQKLLVAVEKLTTTKNWTSFVGNDGGLNIEAMMH